MKKTIAETFVDIKNDINVIQENIVTNDRSIQNTISEIQKTLTNNHFGTCNTAGNDINKVVTVNNFILSEGTEVSVIFNKQNTVKNITLNVNNTGAKPVYCNNEPMPDDYIEANTVYKFIYCQDHYNLLVGPKKGSLTQALEIEPPKKEIGTVWFDSNENVIKYWNGTEWIIFGAAYT